MSDLISRSALIEALENCTTIPNIALDSEVECWIKGVNTALETIEEQPTAYDVEKVVEEIKELSIRTFGEIRTEGVIDIVKRGGCNESVYRKAD